VQPTQAKTNSKKDAIPPKAQATPAKETRSAEEIHAGDKEQVKKTLDIANESKKGPSIAEIKKKFDLSDTAIIVRLVRGTYQMSEILEEKRELRLHADTFRSHLLTPCRTLRPRPV
jgi:predicted alternative tryptophan synthase beta-subunit